MYSARRFKEIFNGETTFKATLRFNENKGKFERIIHREPTQEKDFKGHLCGEEHLCLLPHMRGNYVNFMCIEIKDKLTQDEARQLKIRIPESIRKHFHILKVGDKLYSLFAFFKEKMSVKDVIRFSNYIASLIPHRTSTKPLQNHIDFLLNDVGTAILLPFYGGKDSYLWNGKLTDFNYFSDKVEETRLERKFILNYDIEYGSKEFNDGPPCLQSLTHHSRRVRENEGRVFLKQSSGFLARKGLDVYNGLLNYNSHFLDMPFSEKDIKIKDGIKNYICSDSVISKHCNPYECSRREYGINFNEYSVTMDGLTVVSRDKNDDTYFFTVNGVRVGPLGIDIFTQASRLSTYLTSKFHFIAKFDTNELNKKLVDLFDNATFVKSVKGKDTDIGKTKEAFLSNISEFFENAAMTTDKMDLENDDKVIFEDGIFYYFKQGALKNNDPAMDGLGVRDWKKLVDSLGIFERKTLHLDGPKIRRLVYKVRIDNMQELLKTI